MTKNAWDDVQEMIEYYESAPVFCYLTWFPDEMDEDWAKKFKISKKTLTQDQNVIVSELQDTISEIVKEVESHDQGKVS